MRARKYVTHTYIACWKGPTEMLAATSLRSENQRHRGPWISLLSGELVKEF